MSRNDLPIDPREAMALEEMAATRVTPRAAWLVTASFLAAIVAVPLGQGIAELSEGGPLSRATVIPSAAVSGYEAARADGEGLVSAMFRANRDGLREIEAFDDAIEDGTWLSERLRGPVQQVFSSFAGVGNQRTYLGREGWLFYEPDISYVAGPGFLDRAQLERRVTGVRASADPPQPDPRAAILDFKRQLEARGIALVVMPVPGKATMRPEQFSSRLDRRDAPLENLSYAAFVRDLEDHGVVVFDPAAAILAAGDASPMYLATDTHWRPEVVRTVAARLADMLVARAGIARVPSPYQVVPEPIANTGDLAALLDLPPGSRLYPAEQVTVQRVLDGSGTPVRPLQGSDVLLLGDSFTNIYSQASMGWGSAAGLAEHLAFELGRPVDRIVQNDQGAFATRDLLARQIAGGADRLSAVRGVVYQFAARELAGGDWRGVDLGN